PKLAAPTQLPAPYVPDDAVQPEAGAQLVQPAQAHFQPALAELGAQAEGEMQCLTAAAQPEAEAGAAPASATPSRPAAPVKAGVPAQAMPAIETPAAPVQAARQAFAVGEASAHPVELQAAQGEHAARGQPPGGADFAGIAFTTPGANIPHEPARLAEAHGSRLVAQISASLDKLERSGGAALRLELHPAELGRVELRLLSTAEGLHVSISADNAAAGALLERYLPELRQSLLDAGLRLSDLNVGQHGAQAQLAWDQRGGRRERRAVIGAAQEPDWTPEPAAAVNHSANGVDYRI
ncbi:MAG: flagellar hook-length control protein FliK, partial [Chloroflexi bacterium]|nr:flagellar hook-length control protein FliK [Chloroflexota bacterium]